MMGQELIIGEIESLAFGGQGILRHDGLVVFIPFVAPGDRVRVRITKRKKSFAEGELVELLAPGPQRCVAPCPYFTICGGCQLQHLNEAEQLRQKQRFVSDSLRRIGKLTLAEDVPIIASPKMWAYRRHIRLTLTVRDGVYEAGYVRHDLAGVLPLTQCPIFTEGDSLLVSVQQFLRQLTVVSSEGAHLSLIKSASSYVWMFQFPNVAPPNFESVLDRHPLISGVIVQSKEGCASYGETEGSFSIEGLQIRFSPLAFVQCHPEQSANVYKDVVSLAKGCHPKSVLDLYSGIGVTSLLLGRDNYAVTGVEGNPDAVRLAMMNAQLNQIRGIEFLRADVARVLGGLLDRIAPDLVIVNPPRTGLDPKARQELIEASPRQLIYISCMPSTLARDLAALDDRGYQLKTCRAYDMFPQTTHVETVALMTYEN